MGEESPMTRDSEQVRGYFQPCADDNRQRGLEAYNDEILYLCHARLYVLYKVL